MTTADRLPRLPRRRPEAHKGDCGRVLVVAGSSGMCGAASLTAGAAYRSGAGLVLLATPASLVPVLSTLQPCAVIRALPDTGDGRLAASAGPEIARLAAACDVVALGPGLGTDERTVKAIRSAVSRLACPMVLDADGLNAFQGHAYLLEPGLKILTPHPGELARLKGKTLDAIQKDRVKVADEVAVRLRAVVVLKGHRTVVSDGKRLHVNRTGNPGMATGGSGDVLTGVIAALVGQGMLLFDAARLGAHLHGLAGDIAARRIGMISLMATDILEALPAAFVKHQGRANLPFHR